MDAITKNDEFLDMDDFRATVAEVDKEKPDPEQVAKLQKYLKDFPAVTRYYGNVSRTVQDRILTTVCGTGSLREEVIAYCKLLRREMGFQNAPMLEQMLIDHIVLCWLRLHDCEWNYQNKMASQHSIAEGEFWEKKLTSNQKRYLRAVETLARVRKLAISVQINMAHQQVVTG